MIPLEPRIPVILVALLLTLAAAPLAQAHEDVTAGSYNFRIGWETEPPIADTLNAITIEVTGPPMMLMSPDLAAGGSWSHTFLKEGVFNYHCHQHPWMEGNITIVKPSMAMDAKTVMVKMVEGSGPNDYAFSPENVTIAPGDTIMWMNAGQMVHSVHEGSGASMMKKDDGMGHMSDNTSHDMSGNMSGGHHMEGSHDEMPHAHGDAARMPVMGLEETLTLNVRYGETSTTFPLTKGEKDGLYVARFIPTLSGIYEATITGKIGSVAIDITRDLQLVDPISDHQFPQKAATTYELAEKIAALEAQAKTQAETPATVTETPSAAPVPGPALVVMLAAIGLAAFAWTRRRSS